MRHLPTLLNAKLQRLGNLGGVRSCTLTKITPGARTSGNISGGTNPTSVAYPCAGFLIDYDEGEIDGTLIVVGDRRIGILSASLPATIVPTPGDKIAIADATAVQNTYTIVPKGVRNGAIAGLYDCQVRA